MDAPTEMTFGSLAGEPIVLVEPASPDEATTTTPAATAASSNWSIACSEDTSGNALEPKDSLITLTSSVSTA